MRKQKNAEKGKKDVKKLQEGCFKQLVRLYDSQDPSRGIYS